MNNASYPIFTYLTAALMVLGGIWLLWKWIQKSEEPPIVLIIKWILTAGCLYGIVWAGLKATAFSPIFAVFFGLILAIIWVPSLTGTVGNWFGSIYGMSADNADPTPSYSIVEANRKKGRYREAIAELENQLLRFPEDYRCLLMKAEILAQDLKDVPAAEEVIDEICIGEGRSPAQICASLNQLANWQLNLSKDPDAAAMSLDQIRARYPNSEAARLASQRIAHLTPKKMLDERRHAPRIAMQKGDPHLGTRKSVTEEKQDQSPPPQERSAQDCVDQLTVHPEDFETREQLALIYAKQYKRLDMAEDQLRTLIDMPNAPAKRIAHWYNVIADLSLSEGGNIEKARQALEELIARLPNCAATENARKRIAYLKLEHRSSVQARSIKLGDYEQNIGLKRKS